MNATNSVRQYSVSNNIITPEEINLWPDLRTPRWGPACGATFYHLVVAGGVSAWDEALRSVEVYNIERRSLSRGGRLREARAYFIIVPVGFKHPRLLAIGGRNATSTLSSSELWEEEEATWEEGPDLKTGRSSLSSLMAPPDLVCPENNPLAHTCPALGDTEQMCNLEPGSHNQLYRGGDIRIMILFFNIVFFDEIILNPIQVTRFVWVKMMSLYVRPQQT